MTTGILGMLLSVLAFAFAQSQGSKDAPTSSAATNALATYKEGVRKLNEEHERKLDALRQQYIKELDAARKTALAKDDLEEAQRLLAEKKRVEVEKTPPGNGSGLEILYAVHGVDDQWHDVTTRVRSQVKDAHYHYSGPVFSDLPDLSPNKHKITVISYLFDGKPYLSVVQDDQPFDLPKKTIGPSN